MGRICWGCQVHGDRCGVEETEDEFLLENSLPQADVLSNMYMNVVKAPASSSADLEGLEDPDQDGTFVAAGWTGLAPLTLDTFKL